MERILTAGILTPELKFITSRSSGPGGQNVNKVNTKVTLQFDVVHSQILTEEERQILASKLASRLTTEGILNISSQEKRSQLDNKENVIRKLDELLAKAFTKPKARRATKPSKAVKEKRLQSKKVVSEKKKLRQKPV